LVEVEVDEVDFEVDEEQVVTNIIDYSLYQHNEYM